MTSETIHATSVAVDGRGILILGRSGVGKSSLGLRLIAFGADLVSDDRTIVTRTTSDLIATAPQTISGLIEARGVGLIEMRAVVSAPLALIVDLDQIEAERLPHAHFHKLLERELPCLHNADSPHFPAAILFYLRGTRKE